MAASKSQTPLVDDKYRMATAKFIVQTSLDSPVDVSAMIGTEPGLRLMGEPESRANETISEAAIAVEYGPAVGSLNVALLNTLRRLVKPHAGVVASDVFNFRDRLATKDELCTEADRLTAESLDMALPLSRRKELSDKADSIRAYMAKA